MLKTVGRVHCYVHNKCPYLMVYGCVRLRRVPHALGVAQLVRIFVVRISYQPLLGWRNIRIVDLVVIVAVEFSRVLSCFELGVFVEVAWCNCRNSLVYAQKTLSCVGTRTVLWQSIVVSVDDSYPRWSCAFGGPLFILHMRLKDFVSWCPIQKCKD
jgi:hypothetical protein